MPNIRLPRNLCAVVGEALTGSHQSLEALFISSGAPGDPPDLAHHSKWKEWLFRAGKDPNVDGLEVLGNVLEEFMDTQPLDDDLAAEWHRRRQRVVNALEESGFRYFRGGRILPKGNTSAEISADSASAIASSLKPSSIDDLLQVIIKGLPRAIYPLQHRRKGAIALSFQSEYDIQDLLHALLRPWVSDIRPEEFTPSYAGSSTRMDFLLPAYSLVIETKLIRSKNHGAKIGQELIIDIEHYRCHPRCSILWCVIYDPNLFIQNKEGLIKDLEGDRSDSRGKLTVRIDII